jgi:hypothetical protein
VFLEERLALESRYSAVGGKDGETTYESEDFEETEGRRGRCQEGVEEGETLVISGMRSEGGR